MESNNQVEFILKIDGMHCPMCEEHVNNVIRKVEGVKKVNASYRKSQADIVMAADTDRNAILEAVKGQGYRVLGQEEKPYVKKSIFSIFHHQK